MVMTMYDIPHTVVETDPFLKRAADIWTEEERTEFVDFIASNRMAGDEIPCTGGLRKVRWSRAGMGKRGGVRIIYKNGVKPLSLQGRGCKPSVSLDSGYIFQLSPCLHYLYCKRNIHHSKKFVLSKNASVNTNFLE
jgi:hypothetical protein